MKTYEVAITRVTYYKVVAGDAERAVDLALTIDDIKPGESCSEETDETTGHTVIECGR